MYLLAIDWTEVGLKAGQLILALSILVILHEFGHYITARIFGCRVEKFYLFFDPWFSLFKKKVGDTEYGVGWLPLGGYVKIAGMIDESMDKEAMKKEPQPWEFRTKPAWQRLIIMLGGIIMNVIVAIVIYAFVLQIWGDKKVPTESIKYGIAVTDSTLYKIGLRSGDRIVSVDGKPVEDFERALKSILVANQEIVVDRNGKEEKLKIPIDLLGQLIENKKQGKISLIEPRKPSIVFYVEDSSAAYLSGLRKGDRIIQIDSSPVTFHDEIVHLLTSKKNQRINTVVVRNGEDTTLSLPVNAEGKIGFVPYGYNFMQLDSLGWIKMVTEKYSFVSSFPAAVKLCVQDVVDYAVQLKKMVQPKTGAYKGMGGFKGIANGFSGSEWNWENFWNFTAFISIVLAFMNLLPIPALDGGHVVFTLYEMITRRKPNEKVLEYAQLVGMILLLLLMVYANGNDWFGWGK
ncbi:MAG: RIP metalloprotease RseP [Chitinophagaceae bacterium]|nr:MAG: zinc metalloprotease [Bacteroidetes bacterium OLB11]MCC6448047.1 RIP metalloprotease RseP [Chitinophagaceae bacterium]HMN32319.1 RIP metalloprotease RseP [Chitinophagaceae bacterium]